MNPERWQEVKKILDGVLERPPGERRAYLDQACKDVSLRREVESLILAHDQAESDFLLSPDAASSEAFPLKCGTRLGPYEILAPLGGGGMGQVYRARDTRLHRTVAIKVLPQTFTSDRKQLQRFEQEAQSASALNHPNIITIHDIGNEDGVPYIVMECIDGRSLRRLLDEGPVPLKKVLALATQMADGLAAAHDGGIVHRDLKPENVMVTHGDRVKILDFGLAKSHTLTSADAGNAPTLTGLTTPGTILGTIRYMSPQQASGEPVDFRSDQFSFGTILYELVTGQPAFNRASAAETLAAIIRDELKPGAQFNGQIPPPLQWTIERCLKKNPEDRYASTRDLARDLATLRDRLHERPIDRPAGHPHDLPVQRTPLVGREADLAAAKNLLLSDKVRLVTLTGPGGTGKTRLAIQVAADLLGHYDGGVHFVSLAPIADPSLVVSAIAQALGIRETGRPLLLVLQEVLGGSHTAPTLLLLDNFEHLLDAAPLVSQLLEACAALKVLVTSRAVLHMYGEHEFPVPPLAVPDPQRLTSLAELAGNPAVTLFVERATAVKAGFSLTKGNAADVAGICARLDGLPLAIELAAARIKLFPPSAMLSRLQSSLQILTGGARDIPARQRTLRGTIDWSHDLLTAAEQKLFRRLSVFVGGWTLEAAEAVANTRSDLDADLFESMQSLVDKSLVQQIAQPDGEARFTLLEMVREYGLERLAASGEENATRRAHAAYCLVLAEEGTGAESNERALAAWMELCGLEHDNFRAALDWLTKTADTDWGLRLGTALLRFWIDRDHWVEGRQRLLVLLKLPGAAVRTKSRARALLAASQLGGAAGLADLESAYSLCRESLEISREIGDQSGIIACVNALAFQENHRGEYSVARVLFEECLEISQAVGSDVMVARTHSNLGNVAETEGDYERAETLYQEALRIFEKLGDIDGAAWSFSHLGDIARERGNSAEARAFYERSLAIFRQIDDRFGEAGALADLARLSLDEEDRTTSQILYEQSLRLYQSIGSKRGIPRILERIAGAAASDGQPERALILASAARAIRQRASYLLPADEQVAVDRSLEPARRALTPSAASAAGMAGWTMSLEQAVAYALAPADTAPPLGSDLAD